MNKLTLSALVLMTLSLGLAGLAHAKGAACEHVQDDMFTVDGMTDDWSSFSSTNYGGGEDAALLLRCAYDSTRLYLLLDVRDERVLRSKQGKAQGEDRITLELGVGELRSLQINLLPGGKGAPRKFLSKISQGMDLELEDSLQEGGFSVELSVPLRKLENWASSVPYLSGSVLFHDADKASENKAQTIVGLRGKLHFSDAVETYKAFMSAAGLRNSDIRLDVLADVDPGAGPERIMIGGTVMGVLGTSFSFMNLPIASAADLKSAQVVDFDGSGRKAVLTELTQHGNGGSRDVVIIWFAQGNGRFEPVLTVETRKQRGDSHIVNTWSLVARERHRAGAQKPKKDSKAPKGADLLIQLGEVVGFTEETFREAPAPDARSILTPWSQQSAVYYLEGANAMGGEPAANLDK